MIWTHAAAALAAAAIAFTAGWQVRSWKAGADDAQRQQQEAADAIRRQKQADAAAERHEAQKAEADQRAQRTAREERHVVQAAPYAAVCLDDRGLRLLAEDIAARRPRQPSPAVPGASGPDGQDRR